MDRIYSRRNMLFPAISCHTVQGRGPGAVADVFFVDAHTIYQPHEGVFVLGKLTLMDWLSQMAVSGDILRKPANIAA